jgi:hypothetical protein
MNKPLTGEPLDAKAVELVKRAHASLNLGAISPESLTALREHGDAALGGLDALGRSIGISYEADGLGLRAAYNVFMGRMRELFAPAQEG